MPCHHNLAQYLDGWINAAGLGGDKKGWLFCSIGKGDRLSKNRMDTNDVLRMIKRRAKEAGLPYSTSCYTFRATGITTYLKTGEASNMRSKLPRMNRRALPSSMIAPARPVSLDEIERIEM